MLPVITLASLLLVSGQPEVEVIDAEAFDTLPFDISSLTQPLEALSADLEAAQNGDDSAVLAAALTRYITASAAQQSDFRVADPVMLAAHLATNLERLDSIIQSMPVTVATNYSFGFHFDKTETLDDLGNASRSMQADEDSAEEPSAESLCEGGVFQTGEMILTDDLIVRWDDCRLKQQFDGDFTYVASINFETGDESNGQTVRLAVAAASGDANALEAMANNVDRIVDAAADSLIILRP